MNKKNLLNISLALTFASSYLTPVLAVPDEGAKKTSATEQATGPSISGTVSNGDGAVTFNGEVVWTGKISEGLRTLAEAIVEDGEKQEYAAAWDGDELLWENVSGAGERLEPDDESEATGADNGEGEGNSGSDLEERMKEMMTDGASAKDMSEKMSEMMRDRIAEMMDGARSSSGKDGANSNSTEARSINGKGSVRHNGEEVWKGRIDGKLTAAGETIDADEEGGVAGHFAAAWDDDELIWENYPGAGERLKQTFPHLELGVDPKKKKRAARRKR